MKLIKKYQFGSIIDHGSSLLGNRLQDYDTLETLKKIGDNPNLTEEEAEDILTVDKESKYRRPLNRQISYKDRNILKNDVLGRRKLGYKINSTNDVTTELMRRDAIERGKKIADNLTYQVYPGNLFEKSRQEDVVAQTQNDKIIVNQSYINDPSSIVHEGIHVFQNSNIPLSPFQQEILQDAYGPEFKAAQTGPKDYPYHVEEETLNQDARGEYLRDNYPELLGTGPEKQFNTLNNAPEKDIIKYTEEANKYGQDFINYYREKYKDDPEELERVLKKKADQIKRAWLYVENTRQKENNTPSFT